MEKIVSLEDLDNHTGILHVWFLLLEGVSGAISQCPRAFQPNTMETLFELLRAASLVPGNFCFVKFWKDFVSIICLSVPLFIPPTNNSFVFLKGVGI